MYGFVRGMKDGGEMCLYGCFSCVDMVSSYKDIYDFICLAEVVVVYT